VKRLRSLLRPGGSELFLLMSGLALTATLAAVLLYNFDFGQKRYEPGALATETIKSPDAVSYRSDLLTREAKDRAAASIQPIYHPRSIFEREQAGKIDSFVSRASEIRASSESAAEKAGELRAIGSPSLSRSSADALVRLSDDEWTAFAGLLRDQLTAYQIGREITPENLEEVQAELEDQLGPSYEAAGLPGEARGVFLELGRGLLLPNHVIDTSATERLRNEARDRVSPVVTSIDKGEIIFLSGQKITAADIEKLQAVGLARQSFNVQRFLGELILLGLLVAVGVAYFLIYDGSVRVRRHFVLYAFLLVALAIGAKLTLPIKPIFAYLFPAAAFPLLIYLFLRRLGVALIAAISGALLVGLVAGNSFEILTVQLLASLAAVFASHQVSRISSFLRVATSIAVVNFLAAFGFLLLTTGFESRLAGPLLVGAALSGVLSVFIVVGSAVFLSRSFGITTFIQLLELESPSHPLLADLMFRAPGTYHHSIIMGNMTERAARAVGANPLLARVGVYYHDIGKILSPQWFAENQDRGPNPHDELKNPEQSARHILAHVTEGERLAREHHLPDEIIHIIRSHHGTMLVSYFYEKAKDHSLEPDTAHYRYPGPIPQTKEAALVMLADGIEAMVRSIGNPTEKQIKDAVETIVEARKADGQLRDAPLSFQDLERIKEVFTEVLLAVHHQRVKYPGQEDGPPRR
jgi:cyclic-di-AMP phosphodiesterase PgpH